MRSTNSFDFTTAAVSNSLAKATLDPTALIWVPGAIQSPCSIGSVADVTVQIISAPSTASLAVLQAVMGMSRAGRHLIGKLSGMIKMLTPNPHPGYFACDLHGLEVGSGLYP